VHRGTSAAHGRTRHAHAHCAGHGEICEFTHHNYSACGGRFAWVVVGLGQGWLAEPDSEPTADDVVSHLAEVAATDPYTVPDSIFDEVFAICERLGVTAVG
jgi:hypothetical protein